MLITKVLRSIFARTPADLRRGGGPCDRSSLEQARISLERGDVAAAKALLQDLSRTTARTQAARLLAAWVAGEDGHYADARSMLENLIRDEPQFADAQVLLANFMRRQGEPGAVAIVQRALSLGVPSALARLEMALALAGLGKCAQAAAEIDIAANSAIDELRRLRPRLQREIEARNDDAGVYFVHGMTAMKFDDFAVAAASLAQAQQLGLRCPEVSVNRGIALLNLRRAEEAVSVFESLGAAIGNSRESMFYLKIAKGVMLRERGALGEAVTAFDEALSVAPGHYAALLHRGIARLLARDYAGGWSDYEARTVKEGRRVKPFRSREWQGEDLSGASVLVYAEQGLGDEIMFASCIPDLLSCCRCCVIECDPRLADLYRRSFPDALIHGASQVDADPAWLWSSDKVDFQVAVGGLPRRFRTRVEEFPLRPGYLRADHEKVASWRERLTSLGAGLKVGISWRGGGVNTQGNLRSIDLAEWTSILRCENARFVSLQYGNCEQEIEEAWKAHCVRIHRWPEASADLDETAALISALDLVITVDNTLAHLAGALGQRGWVLLPGVPEWRWGIKGDRCDWYPSLRLWRQSAPAEWGPALASVADALAREGAGAR